MSENESKSVTEAKLPLDGESYTDILPEKVGKAEGTMKTSVDEVQDWRTQVRESITELEQPELLPKIIDMMEK